MTDIKEIRAYAEAAYHIHPKLVLELLDKLETAERSAARWANVFGHLGTPDECGNEWSALVDKLEAAEREIAYKQSKIDSLMLEYCPDEMTEEQLHVWGENQVSHVE